MEASAVVAAADTPCLEVHAADTAVAEADILAEGDNLPVEGGILAAEEDTPCFVEIPVVEILCQLCSFDSEVLGVLLDL